MACVVVHYVFQSLVLHITGASYFICQYKSVEIRIGFTMSRHQCREVRVYFYSAVDPFTCVLEEMFSFDSLITPFPFFLPFQCGFFFKFTPPNVGNNVKDDCLISSHLTILRIYNHQNTGFMITTPYLCLLVLFSVVRILVIAAFP